MPKMEEIVVIKRSNKAKKEKTTKPFNLFTYLLAKRVAEADMKKEKAGK